ncbi:hypothetical protein E2C01_074451 [Portunus trituberculatus]|uniref:Uncharacterized protein n=1 Tax=Portunus trituberculatus TaxID=210409 RepID=A0A5B7IEC3_PORTR|nr:hypothetical protein [Portunus trituberculatus]
MRPIHQASRPVQQVRRRSRQPYPNRLVAPLPDAQPIPSFVLSYHLHRPRHRRRHRCSCQRKPERASLLAKMARDFIYVRIFIYLFIHSIP